MVSYKIEEAIAKLYLENLELKDKLKSSEIMCNYWRDKFQNSGMKEEDDFVFKP